MSQSQEDASIATDTWKINFPSLGDPTCSIPSEVETRGLLKICVDKDMGAALNGEYNTKDQELVDKLRTGSRHTHGVIQPAILVLDRDFTVLYRWASYPSWKNFGGAIARPKAQDVWTAVQQSLAGDLSQREGKSGWTVPAPIFFLFLIATLVNGYFIRPVGFGLDASGHHTSARGKPKVAMAKAFILLCLLFSVFVCLPRARLPLGASLTAYSMYIYYCWGDTANRLWKLKTPPKR